MEGLTLQVPGLFLRLSAPVDGADECNAVETRVDIVFIDPFAPWMRALPLESGSSLAFLRLTSHSKGPSFPIEPPGPPLMTTTTTFQVFPLFFFSVFVFLFGALSVPKDDMPGEGGGWKHLSLGERGERGVGCHSGLGHTTPDERRGTEQGGGSAE